MRRCPICGSETNWESDFMGDEMGMDNAPDVIVQINHCPNCDIDYYDFLDLDEAVEKEEAL